MPKLLDRTHEEEVAQEVQDNLLDEGYSAEEIIPGLVLAIEELSLMTDDPNQALDEAANILAEPIE